MHAWILICFGPHHQLCSVLSPGSVLRDHSKQTLETTWVECIQQEALSHHILIWPLYMHSWVRSLLLFLFFLRACEGYLKNAISNIPDITFSVMLVWSLPIVFLPLNLLYSFLVRVIIIFWVQSLEKDLSVCWNYNSLF